MYFLADKADNFSIEIDLIRKTLSVSAIRQ